MSRKINATENIRIERIWSMPNKNTFEIVPIKSLLAEEVDLSKFWIDPFANRNKLASVTNDLCLDYDTDYHLDALDFLKMFDDSSVDGVLYDPPYSPRQVSECYNDVGYSVTWDTTKASFWGNHKREISRIVKIGGKVITFGWNSGGIGYKYGFEIQRILLVPHGGWHNDTICTVEVKTHEGDYRPSNSIDEEKKGSEKTMVTAADKQLIEKIRQLPVDYWDFREDDTKEYTHGIHNYPAMMVCPISRNIIRMVKDIQPVNALLDPFAGSGTVLVEGMYRRVIWQCNRKFSKTQEQCKTPHLTEDAIKEMFLKAYNRLMRQRKQLIEDCELMKSLLTDCAEQEAGMEQLRQEIEEIADMTQNLVRQNTRQTQSQEAYNAKYNALAERYEKASAKHDKLEAEVARRKNKARQIAAFIDQLEKAPASLEEWDSQVWSLLLEKGTVNRDGSITFEFRNGKEINVEAK